MSNPNKVWGDLKKKLGDDIGIWCKKCVPSSHSEPRKNCEHEERYLWVYCKSSALGKESWTMARERPQDLVEQLCLNKRCKRTKKCGKAHSESEREVWRILKTHNRFLHFFVKNLIYYEEPSKPEPVKPKHTLKRSGKMNRCGSSYKSNRNIDRERNESRFGQLLKRCGGGRFLFVCNHCYHLDPKMLKEMNMGDGKNSRIYCSMCGQNKTYFLLHETVEKNKNGVTFYEYQRIRERLSTSFGNQMCKRLLNCRNPKDCTYAHSFLELWVWQLEVFEQRRIELVRYCNSKADKRRETLEGMFHCDLCCISFTDHRVYRRYMGSKHKHFADICRPYTCTWTYRPLTQEKTLSMCRIPDCQGNQLCIEAHSEEELNEWQQRMSIKAARERFRFQSETESSGFNLHQQPELIYSANDVKIEVESTKIAMPFETKTNKWNIKISTSDKSFLKRIGFPHQQDFQIRKAVDKDYSRLINMLEPQSAHNVFFVLFTNPKTYGRHVGDLIFEFTGKNRPYYLRFEVEIEGERFCIPERSTNPNDWTRNRLIVKYQNDDEVQLSSYENTVKELEYKYPLPKVVDAVVDMKHTELKNYKEKMHSLLYREEHARRTVLSKLNMLCDVQFHNLSDNGHLLADFTIPWSISTDEGLLFRNGCNMVYLGEMNSDHAYESIKQQAEGKRIRIDISPECVRGLKIKPGSSRELRVQFQLDRGLFCLRHYAVDMIEASLVCPSSGRYALLQYNGETVAHKHLNDEQNAVLHHTQLEKQRTSGNAEKSYPPLIVVGPFGTGKTHTIKEIILNLMANNGENCTILLCTHSNSSADLYVKDQRFQQWASKILRLYYHKRNPVTVDDDVKKFCLPNGLGFRYPQMDEIRKKKLVVTTFVTALTLVLETGLQKNAFTHIFLDEASQAMEAEVIMPLLLADYRNTRIVFAGDHRQMTERMYSDQFNQIQTLLERMYEAYENVSKRCQVLFTKNYRSAPGIISLLTKLFYKDNLLDNAGMVECLPKTKFAYFIHLQGQCVAVNEEYANGAEANQIMQQVRWVLDNKLADEQDILAVAAYYSQVKYIRQILRKDGLGKVSVQPVGNIQGQQFKVVLLSCVMRRVQCLETYGENFGFLSDYRLLNTVLTRAQSLIVVVGDAVTLCSVGKCEKYWKTYVRHCAENGTFLPKGIDIESVKKEILLAKQKLNASAFEFTPSANPSEERVNEDEEQEMKQEKSREDTSEYDDDNDSWCSEDSVDDLILDDMIKSKTGIDWGKVTVAVHEDGDEYICYSSEEEDDPNEMSEAPSRRAAGRKEAIYSKFTIDHLKQMLRTDTRGVYKRCKIVMENWFSAQAIPICDNADDNRFEKTPPSASPDASLKSDASSIDNEDLEAEDALENEAARVEARAVSVDSTTPVTINPVIFIETKRYLGRTFNNDEVLVEIIKTRHDPSRPSMKKQIGKVLGVLQKRNLRSRRFLCRTDQYNSSIMCPFDKKITKFAILIPKHHTQSARSGVPIYKAIFRKGKWMDLELLGWKEADDRTAYVVRYLKWSVHCPYPLGFVEASFDLGDYAKFLELEYGVPSHYRKSVLEQAQAVKALQSDKNITEVFTIDPEKSVDLDDAISFRKCASHAHCFEIGIHITDVASVIKEGSELDKDAMRRLATFYGSDDGPVHMLPPALSANKCSILPGEVRRAISTYFHSRDGPPHDKDFRPITPKRTLIRSTKRLSYAETEQLFRDSIKGKPLSREDLHYADTIREMWNIMWDWRVNRLEGEAFYKNADSYIELFEECRAHLLIEEAMVSVNANTALYLRDKDFDIPMRVQDVPDEQEWADWNRVHTNLIPNSSYLKSCSKYLKKLKRINEGGEDVEANLSEEEEEDDSQWQEALSRRRKRERKKIGANPITASIDPIDDIWIFENYWKDMLNCKEKGDLELFAFVAACDDLHPSLIGSSDGYRQLQKKGTISLTKHLHFSLRITNYAWSSSPIRRYIDITIQRCIHKALADERPTEAMNRAIERICRCYDNRHKQYEEKLIRADLATFLQNHPIVFEACITQITDGFIKISIPPMGKHMMRQAREINYQCLMLTQSDKNQIPDTLSDENQIRVDGKTLLSSIELIWNLRYYEYDTKVARKKINEPSAVMKIPANCWRTFVNTISNPPRLSDSDYKKEEYLKDAVDRMTNNASHEELRRSVKMREFTPNDPDPIPHRREMQWTAMPGTSILVQLSGSQDRLSKLPVPTVQLFSIDEDLDVCVEHMAEPLDTFARDAEQSTDKITSLKSYRKKWEPLVRMDAAYTTAKENSSLTIQGVTIKWGKAASQDEEDSRKDNFFAEEEEQAEINCFELKHSFCFDRYIDFHRGDLLCLRLKNVPCVWDDKSRSRWKSQMVGTRSTSTSVVHGAITEVAKPRKFDRGKNKHVKVCFETFTKNFPKLQRAFVESAEKKWTVEVIPLSYVHRHMQASLSGLNQCSLLVRSICLGTIRQSRINWPDATEEFIDKPLKKFKESLNDKQKDQERYAVTHNFSLIQGPPGTGKSFLGARLAAKFAYINKQVGNGQKVLYCGPSNKSVDVAAGNLKNVDDLRIVRMYSHSLEEKLYPNPLKPYNSSVMGDDGKKPDDNLTLVTLHKLIRRRENPYCEAIKTFDAKVRSGDSIAREDLEKYSSLVNKAKLHELFKADIIICTCSVSCQLKDMRGSKEASDAHELKFSQCIIDECAMCSEPETILPLVATNPNQIVLIGDHMQLKPVITCTRAETLGLGISLFSRYADLAGMLENQYRMHPSIMEFPSRQFYDNKLTCAHSVTQRPRLRNEPFASWNEAVFWNVPGEERTQHFKSTEEGYRSKYNILQAAAVVKILQRLRGHRVLPRQIMVLSPYKAQCARIREQISSRFDQNEVGDFHVGTVVTSQGSEADYVILSTVRSLPTSSIMESPNAQWLGKNLGFLTDRHQTNVALTRARRRLFIIGNERLLQADALWNKLLSFYRSKHAVTNNLIPT